VVHCGFVIRLRLSSGRADPKFLVYLLRSPAYRQRIINISGGSAITNISQSSLRELLVDLPPLSTQRKIAAVLAACDDLIENSMRRIAILEEMAQLIYREWFVHYRFPGHEDVQMVDSELGPIPEGWEIAPLGKVCELVAGQSPRSEFYNEEGRGLPFHQGVTDFGTLYPVTRRYCTVTKRVAQKGDILFSVRAPVGRMNIADRTIVIGRGLHAIRSKSGNQTFTFLQLRDKFHEEDMIGGGTIFRSVTKADMLGITLLAPPSLLVATFELNANPMLAQLEVLTRKNGLLRQGRDLLLPRLVSGDIDVSEVNVSRAESHR